MQDAFSQYLMTEHRAPHTNPRKIFEFSKTFDIIDDGNHAQQRVSRLNFHQEARLWTTSHMLRPPGYRNCAVTWRNICFVPYSVTKYLNYCTALLTKMNAKFAFFLGRALQRFVIFIEYDEYQVLESLHTKHHQIHKDNLVSIQPTSYDHLAQVLILSDLISTGYQTMKDPARFVIKSSFRKIRNIIKSCRCLLIVVQYQGTFFALTRVTGSNAHESNGCDIHI